MSQLKKKKKSKGEPLIVSQPLNFEHRAHIGTQQAPTVETLVEPPTPCQGPELYQDAKTFQKLLQSSDFQETLRNIVHEALEAERPKLLKEIERIHQPPAPCISGLKEYSEPYATATKDTDAAVSNTSEVIDHSGAIDDHSDAFAEHVEDPNVSYRFGNPTYDLRGNSVKVKPNPAPRNRRNQESQSSLTELKEVENAVKHKFGPRTVLRRDDERECMSQALQANIVALVDRLVVNVSDLPDQLIEAGHMTEDECRMLRKDITSRKDQVRYLVSRTKCRDLDDINMFLTLIKHEIPDVVEKILAKFEENKRNNVRCATCALCQCSNNIDIKDVVDTLWSVRAVSDGFYNEVIACTKPRGSQENLWKALVDICNSKNSTERKKVYGMLFEFMYKKGNFEFIIKPMSCMLEKDGRLECRCHSSLKASLSDRGSYGVLSSCSPRSSVSEGSCRQSSFSGDYSQEIVQVEERLGKGGSMKPRKLERQAEVDRSDLEDILPKQRLSHAKSLELLETIHEETGKTGRKGIDFVYQTMEFHGPVSETVDFKKGVTDSSEFALDGNSNFCKTENESMETRRVERSVQELSNFDFNRSSEV